MTVAIAAQAAALAFDWEFDWPEDDAPAVEFNEHYDAIASRTLAGQAVGLGSSGEMTAEFWAIGEHCPMLPPVCEPDDETEGDGDWIAWGVRDDGDLAYDEWCDDRLTA